MGLCFGFLVILTVLQKPQRGEGMGYTEGMDEIDLGGEWALVILRSLGSLYFSSVALVWVESGERC